MNKKYTLLQNRFGYTAGATVYEYMRHDYGCSRDDEAATGERHLSVTVSPDGGAPFFTAPISILKAQ